MGRLHNFGKKLYENTFISGHISTPDDGFFAKPRIGMILGTGWSNPDVLREQGFVLQETLPFPALDLSAKSGAGHPNAFLFGTWHDKDVVISQGRFHLYQDRGFGNESLIRQWMSLLFYFMNGSKQLVTGSAVGGLSEYMKEDMIVMPTGIVSAHLPQPHLIGGDGEFVLPEQLLWSSDHTGRKVREGDCVMVQGLEAVFIRKMDCFMGATMKISQGISKHSFVTHYVIPGPGFGGATERKLWASLGFDTVGMSLAPELQLVSLENLDNRPKGIASAYHETDIRVFPLLFISDAHDLANNDEIIARAKAMAPNFGKFLSHVIRSEW